jgi:hypothetical protein
MAGTRAPAPAVGAGAARVNLSAGNLLHLQRQAGNAAVTGVLQRSCAGPGQCGCERCGDEEERVEPSPAPVQRQAPPAAPPQPGVVPPGYGVEHRVSRLRFTDQTTDVRRVLERFLAQRNDLKALDLFDGDADFVGPLPLGGLIPGCDLDPATCTRYLHDVRRIVREQVRALRTDTEAFQKDLERRGVDTLGLLLDDSEEKINAEKERYGLQKKEGAFSFLVGADYSMNPAQDLTSAAQALLDSYLAVGTAADALKRCTDLGGTLPPGGVEGMCSDDDRARSETNLKKAEKDYIALRKTKEGVHPVLISYDLGLESPATHGTLAALTAASGDTKAEMLYEQLAEKLGNIKTTREHVLKDWSSVWKLDTVLGITRKLPDIAAHEKLPARDLQDIAVADAKSGVVLDEVIRTAAVAAITVGLGMVAGPLGAAGMHALRLAVVATDVGIGVAQTLSAIREYQFEQAATNTDLDAKARSISQEEPSLIWLALDIVMTAAQLKAAADEFRAFVRMYRSAVAAKAAGSSSSKKLLDELHDRAEEKYGTDKADKLRRQADELGATAAGDAGEIAGNLHKAVPLGGGAYTHEIPMGGGKFWRRTAEGRWCYFASPPRCPIGVTDAMLSPTLAGLSPETSAALMNAPEIRKLAALDIRVGDLLERHGVAGLKVMQHASANGEDGVLLLQRFDKIAHLKGAGRLLADMAAGSSTTRGAIGELYIIEKLVADGIKIERVAHKVGGKKAGDILLSGIVIDVKYYDWTKWWWQDPGLVAKSASKLAGQVALHQERYPGRAVIFVFAGATSDIPPAIVTALKGAGAYVNGSH